MNTLPIELETEIWNMYWKGVFKENVLDRFKKTRDSDWQHSLGTMLWCPALILTD